MKTTYRAMQIAAPGRLEQVERLIPSPAADEVLIKIDACGVCGADLSDIKKNIGLAQPRIPGHEVVGHIAGKGDAVPYWQIGQRVGVGRLGGYCQHCEPCRKGQFHLCENQLTPGLSCDGGYAEYMVIRYTALIAIPAELSAIDAAPILCAGTATFNALRKSAATPGDKVAILGMGGLGHMAIQYAHHMGFETIVIARGQDKAATAGALGGHHYIDSQQEPVLERLKSLGGVNILLATAPDSEAVSALIPALAPQGNVILLGNGNTPLQIMPGLMIGAERTVSSQFVSTPAESERALRFSQLFHTLPVTETMPLEQANEALQRLKTGQVRYRIVLTPHQSG